MRNLFLFTLLLTATALTAQNRTSLKKDPYETSFAKGLSWEAADTTFLINAGFRFQNLLVATAASDAMDEVDITGMVRRARIKFDGYVYRPEIQYKFELGLSNRDIGGPIPEANNASNIVFDAVVKWKFLPKTAVWFGQTKLPGNRERVISSQALQFVDRSMVNGEYNIDRDWGLQLHHEFDLGKIIVRDIYAISKGEGRNLTNRNAGGYEYTARIEVLPFGKFTEKGDYVGGDIYREKEPKLSIAATYDYNDDASREGGQLGDYLGGTSDLRTVFADMMFKYRGISVMAEYADKKGDNPLVFDDAGMISGRFLTGTGLNVQAGYVFPNYYEVAARYTEINPTSFTGAPSQYMYTIGLSHYIVGHNLKWQTDFSLTDTEAATADEFMARFQVEVAF